MSQTTFRNNGDIIDYVAGSDLKSGDIVFIDDICGQVVRDIANGATGAVRIEGLIRVSKASGTVFAGGALVHWDATNELAVDVDTDGLLGRAVGGGADGETYVDVKINY